MRLRRGPDKAQATIPLESPMSGIYVIIAFIVVIAVLNRVEFGRFD